MRGYARGREFETLQLDRWQAPQLVFFFFQAEDGIRVLYVTGVQTCALPIFSIPSIPPSLVADGGKACASSAEVAQKSDVVIVMVPDTPHVEAALFGERGVARSEERRVGKACSSRWAPHRQKTKKQAV